MKTMTLIINLMVFTVCINLFAAAPEWEDNSGSYQFVSFLAGGIVINDGLQMGGEGDMFAALDTQGTVRGVAVELSPSLGTYAGKPVWEMTIYFTQIGDMMVEGIIWRPPVGQPFFRKKFSFIKKQSPRTHRPSQ